MAVNTKIISIIALFMQISSSLSATTKAKAKVPAIGPHTKKDCVKGTHFFGHDMGPERRDCNMSIIDCVMAKGNSCIHNDDRCKKENYDKKTLSCKKCDDGYKLKKDTYSGDYCESTSWWTFTWIALACAGFLFFLALCPCICFAAEICACICCCLVD